MPAVGLGGSDIIVLDQQAAPLLVLCFLCLPPYFFLCDMS